jgi:hypothetical protein
MNKCKVTDCHKKSMSKGFCGMHYHRFKRYGNPLNGCDFRDRNPPEKCTINGCDRKHNGKGFCIMHYKRFKKYGDANKTLIKPKGSIQINDAGYIVIRKNNKTIREHRLVMENYLGRKLLPFPYEVIHHIDGNRTNNNISNLIIMTNSEHTSMHRKESISKNGNTFQNKFFGPGKRQ